jgi:hypothetical protein
MSDTPFADSILAIVPWYARTGNVGKVLYTIGVGIDQVVDAVQQGVEMRIPGRGDSSGLGYIAADRLMDRGRTESDGNFITDLIGAFRTLRGWGSPRTLALQLLNYISPQNPIVRVIGDSSIWDTIDASGAWSVFYGSSNWNWDGSVSPAAYDPSPKWWRLFVVFYQSSFAQNAFTWDTHPFGTWDAWAANSTWDTNATPSDVEAVKRLVTKWKAAHNQGVDDATEVQRPMVIVSFDPALFDPSKPAGGAFNPDGLFGRQYKSVGGVVTPSRFAAISCWEGL